MPRSISASFRGNLSLVVSFLALAVALSGTAYAVGLAPGSVDTRELAKGAVTAKKLKREAVTARKIRPGAVGATAIDDGSVGAAELADGSVGAAEVADGAVGAAEVANGAVGAAEVADGSLGAADLADNSVGAAELANAAVGTGEVADRSLRLSDLGGSDADLGPVTDQVTTISGPLAIAAGDCRVIGLRLWNPTPPGLVGSMVVGTITTSTGGAVVNNTGAVLPTLITETSQNGALAQMVVCAGGSAQTIPNGSIATWSLIAP